MKKLLYIFFLLSFLFIYFPTETSNISTITAGLPVVSKCYKRLPGVESRPGNGFKNDRYETQKVNRNVSSILPAYFWDTKMMTW